MADTVRTRHNISGQIDENTPRHIAEHPILGRHLEIVGPGVKPYLPTLHRPKVDGVNEAGPATEAEAKGNKKDGKE